MFFTLGLALLFFLPIVESLDRQIALYVLLISSVFISFSLFWKRKFHFDFIDLLWLLMLVIFSISTTVSWSFSKSYLELLRYFAYFLIFIAIRNYHQLQILVKRFFIPMVITNSIILSLLFFSSTFLKLLLPTSSMSLYYPVFLGHNHLADILLFAIPIALFISKRYFSILLSLFFSAMLFTSLSRGALLALTFSLLIYFIAQKLLSKSYQYLSIWILLLTTFTVVFLLSSFVYSNFWISGNNKSTAVKGFYKPVTNENRLEYFTQGWQGFSKSPIFGSGLDTFRYVSKIYQSESAHWSWYTHNHFLQIFTETGFLGGLLFLTLIITLLFKSFKKINYQLSIINYQSHGLFIGVFASCIHSLIDFDWQFISIFLIFFIAAALLTARNANLGDRKISWLQRIFILIIILMFLFPFLFEINSDNLISQADRAIKAGNLDEAKRILLKSYSLDMKNGEVSEKVGDIEARNNNYEAVHHWYRNAILLDPLDSQNIIKKDLILYTDQAKIALGKKDFWTGYNYIAQAAKIYYPYYQSVDGAYYLFNADRSIKNNKKSEAIKFLKDYLKVIQRQVNKYKLTKEEILDIAHSQEKMFIDK